MIHFIIDDILLRLKRLENPTDDEEYRSLARCIYVSLGPKFEAKLRTQMNGMNYDEKTRKIKWQFVNGKESYKEISLFILGDLTQEFTRIMEGIKNEIK